MYNCETDKIKDRIFQYLDGFVIDIGSAEYPVKPDAFCIDGRMFPNVKLQTDNLYTLPEQLHGQIPLADVVYSSHLLEHLADHYGAIHSWTKLLRVGGYLILYLPDGAYYDNKENQEHMHDTRYEYFMFWFKRVWCGEGKDFRGQNFEPVYTIVESGMDIGEQRYSFYLVAKKL